MEKEISIFLKILGILIFIGILYLIKDIIFLLILSLILAAFLRPGVNWLERKKIPRIIGTLLIFVLVFLIFFGIFFLILPPLISEFQNFFKFWPQYWQNFLLWLPQFESWLEKLPLAFNLEQAISRVFEKLSTLFGKIFGLAYGLGQMLLNLIFVFIAAFYFVIEKDLFQKISDFTGKKEKILFYFGIFERTTQRWLGQYLISAIIVGILTYFFLFLIKVKYALSLAFLAGIFEIIPILGPLMAGILIFIFSFFQGGIGLAIWALVFFFIIEQINNYFILPFLTKKIVKLNPILVILSLFIGGKLAGILGIIIAIPLAASILNFLKESKEIKAVKQTELLN